MALSTVRRCVWLGFVVLALAASLAPEPAWALPEVPSQALDAAATPEAPQAAWPYVLGGLAGLLAAGGLIQMHARRKVRYWQQRNQALKTLVAQRTEALERHNDLLRRANDAFSDANDELTQANALLERANRRMARQTQVLRASLKENSEILGIAAHDLKNPLTGIIGLADVVTVGLKEPDPDQPLDELVGLIKHEAEHAFQIITDLLDSRHYDTPAELQIEPLDVNDLVDTVVRWNEAQAERKQIALHVRPAEDATVEADASAVQRVLDNLISNAIKYSPSGHAVYVCVQPSADEVCCTVADEGPGLTEEDKQKVFGKLQRLSAKPTGGEHATGLGLYIVKQLVEQHGGRVWVESTHGDGATFGFVLPRQAAPAQATTPRAARRAA